MLDVFDDGVMFGRAADLCAKTSGLLTTRIEDVRLDLYLLKIDDGYG